MATQGNEGPGGGVGSKAPLNDCRNRVRSVSLETDADGGGAKASCELIVRRTEHLLGETAANALLPADAALLFDKAMLEWQISLARSLRRWVRASSSGALILAWANLGALVEGMLKFYLTAYVEDFRNALVEDCRRVKNDEPSSCKLEMLRHFCNKHIWNEEWNWDPYVYEVQQRRNAIHAFQSRDIGTFADWREALRLHRSFIQDIGTCFPW